MDHPGGEGPSRSRLPDEGRSPRSSRAAGSRALAPNPLTCEGSWRAPSATSRRSRTPPARDSVVSMARVVVRVKDRPRRRHLWPHPKVAEESEGSPSGGMPRHRGHRPDVRLEFLGGLDCLVDWTYRVRRLRSGQVVLTRPERKPVIQERNPRREDTGRAMSQENVDLVRRFYEPATSKAEDVERDAEDHGALPSGRRVDHTGGRGRSRTYRARGGVREGGSSDGY